MKKIFSLPMPVLMVIAIMTGVASAGLVNYLSDTIISETIEIKSPIEITGGIWESSQYGGNADITLVTFKNRAEVPITGTAELAVDKWDGTKWVNFEQPGMQLAVSTDIKYAWAAGKGDAWRDWLSANPEWMNWILSDPHDLPNLKRYKTTEISPLHVGLEGRDGVLGYCRESGDYKTGDPDGTRDLRTEITWDEGEGAWIIPNLTIPAEKIVPVAIWVVTNPALEPGRYRFSLTIRP